jgi:hypothetical protein
MKIDSVFRMFELILAEMEKGNDVTLVITSTGGLRPGGLHFPAGWEEQIRSAGVQSVRLRDGG